MRTKTKLYQPKIRKHRKTLRFDENILNDIDLLAKELKLDFSNTVRSLLSDAIKNKRGKNGK